MATFLVNSASKNDEINCLRARALLVDMEEGVLNSIKASDIGDLFDQDSYVSSSNGSGNNWAVGYQEYGPRFRQELIDKILRQVEQCSSLSTFVLIHSLGGGTGSGLGSYINELLLEYYPNVLHL